MKKIRRILFPFSVPYWLATACRNMMYDKGIKASYTFKLPVICIGNLSTGGTGKTPQTEYLIRLLKDRFAVGVLSRGYRRKTEGFVLAGRNSTAAMLGDEPYQMYRKFPDIILAVDADRRNGIELLLQLKQPPAVLLLDDAYQHRRVTAGFYILLTAYGDLFTDDAILPAGNLREGRGGAGRADVIVVTKCPPDISAAAQQKVIRKIRKYSSKDIFFTTIAYGEKLYSVGGGSIAVAEVKLAEKVLVAGIAKPKPFFDYLYGPGTICREYPDHHDFTVKQLEELNRLAEDKRIITTEKDFVRLQGKLPDDRLFYLPMQTAFISGGDVFDKKIMDYVEQSTANR